jgi:hypothetical protein
LPKSRWAPSPQRISYEASRGALREILAVCTNQEFSVSRVQVEDKPFRGKGQSGAQAGKGRGTGWEDHPEENRRGVIGRPAKGGDCNAPSRSSRRAACREAGRAIERDRGRHCGLNRRKKPRCNARMIRARGRGGLSGSARWRGKLRKSRAILRRRKSCRFARTT